MFDFSEWLVSTVPTYALTVPLCMVGFYLVMPLIVRSTWKVAADPGFKVLDLKAIEPAVARFLAGHATTLLELGFDEPTNLRVPNATPNVTAYLVTLVNRQTGDKAMVTVIIGDAMPRLETWYVEFNTRYDTGEVFDTLNSAELNPFPPGPQAVRTQVPGVRDVEDLLALHRFVQAKHAPAGKPWVYEPGTVVAYLTEYAWTKPFGHEVARGTLSLDAPAEVYRMTVLGAYRIVGGLMQPIKVLRQLAMRRAERRILGEFARARG